MLYDIMLRSNILHWNVTYVSMLSYRVILRFVVFEHISYDASYCIDISCVIPHHCPLHSISLYCIRLHVITIHYITLHHMLPEHIISEHMVLNNIALYCIGLPCLGLTCLGSCCIAQVHEIGDGTILHGTIPSSLY